MIIFDVGSQIYRLHDPDIQIPYVGGAMVPYGKDSLLYVGGWKGSLTEGEFSGTIYQFLGPEMRVRIFREVKEEEFS